MATGYKVGRMVKTYLDAMGAGEGTYTELAITKAPSFSPAWDEAVVEDHASDIKRAMKGMLDLPLELEMNMKTGDAQYEALRTAFLSADEGVIGIALCTGDMITGIGEHLLEMDAEVLSWSESNSIGDTVTVTASVKPAANTLFVPTFSVIAGV